MGGAVDPLYVFDNKENLSRNTNKNKPDTSGPDGNVKRDFFGRIIVDKPNPLGEADGNAGGGGKRRKEKETGQRVWVTYHEGLNNAVTKPISLEEFLRGL
jgi:chromosome transmission fidelity protein 18